MIAYHDYHDLLEYITMGMFSFQLWAARIKDFAFAEEMHPEESLDNPSDIYLFERPLMDEGEAASQEDIEIAVENGNGLHVEKNGNGVHVENNCNGVLVENNCNGVLGENNGNGLHFQNNSSDVHAGNNGTGDVLMQNGTDTASENGKNDHNVANDGDGSGNENGEKDAAMDVGDVAREEDPNAARIAALKDRRCPVVVFEVASGEGGLEPKLCAMPLVYFASPGQRSLK